MCLLNRSYKYYNEETLTSVQEFQMRMSTLKERSGYEAFEIKFIMKETDSHEKKLIMHRSIMHIKNQFRPSNKCEEEGALKLLFKIFQYF